jgi:hypothetical protein
MIDIKKKYKTRSGLDVRLVSDQGHPDWPIVGFVGDCSEPLTWKQDGTFFSKHAHDYDLVEVKEKKVMYILMDEYGNLDTSGTADITDRESYTTRIRVEYEEGQFDE